jgi:hypothetical protein
MDRDMDPDDDWSIIGILKDWNFSRIWKMADISKVPV